MVKFERLFLGFIFLELTLIASGLHYHHQRQQQRPVPPPNRPRPPPPPPRRPPPPPPRPPPPSTPGTTTTQVPTTTTTPAPEAVEVELEDILPGTNTTTTSAPTTVSIKRSSTYPAHYQYGHYYHPYYNYYGQYQPTKQYGQPYGQNHNYNQAYNYYYGNYTGQSSLAGHAGHAGHGQNPPTYQYVTNAPYPSPYPHYTNYPQNNHYAVTQSPPAVVNQHAQPHNYAPNPNQQGPNANAYPSYNYHAASVPPPTSGPYKPPAQGNVYKPPYQDNVRLYDAPTQAPPVPQQNYYAQPAPLQQAGPAPQPAPLQQAGPAPQTAPLQQAGLASQQQSYQQINTYNQQQHTAYTGPRDPAPKTRTHAAIEHTSRHQQHNYRTNQQQRAHALPTPPVNNRAPPRGTDSQARNDRRQSLSVTSNQKPQQANRHPIVDDRYSKQYVDRGQSSYPSDVNLPAPPTPLSESKYRQPADLPVDVKEPTGIRYRETFKLTKSESGPTKRIYIQTLDRQPESKTIESRYRQTADRRRSDLNPTESRYFVSDQKQAENRRGSNVLKVDIPYEQTLLESTRPLEPQISDTRYVQSADTKRRTESTNVEVRYLKQSDANLSPTLPGEFVYLKPSDKKPPATIKAEYNYLKESENKRRLPLENQLADIKQRKLLKLLENEKQTQKSLKKENLYLKALFKRNKKKEEANKQCPLYKYSIEENRIEIHTEPGRCKIVIQLPKNGKGKAKVAYLAKN